MTPYGEKGDTFKTLFTLEQPVKPRVCCVLPVDVEQRNDDLSYIFRSASLRQLVVFLEELDKCCITFKHGRQGRYTLGFFVSTVTKPKRCPYLSNSVFLKTALS